MPATSFDTLKAIRDLEAVGIERRQAEAHAEALRDAADAAAGADRADHATKADLDELRRETKADLHREIGALRSELRWMFGFQAALILAVAAKLFGIV